MYSKKIAAMLKAKGIVEGDRVKVIGTENVEGILLPSPDHANPDVVIVKMDTGYNAGIKPLSVEKLDGHKEFGGIPTAKIARHEGLPEVSLIATGGTIGTHVDYTTGGVFMCRTPEEILSTTPELAGVVNFKSILSPFTLASEDMNHTHWQILAREIAKELNGGAAGVIVTHGTDCLGYTAAALSFMLRNLSKPVALVGAQRSPDRGSFDGALNLLCGAHYAKSNYAGVAVVMHGSSSDNYCLAVRGTKVRKMHSTRRDAFRAINDRPLARIWPDGKIEAVNNHYENCSGKKVKADVGFEPRVAMLKAYPGADPSVVDFFVSKKFKGIIIEGTALGHVPTGQSGTRVGEFDKKMSWLPAVKNAVDNGVFVGIATQCVYGQVNPFVYRNLRLASEAGAVHLEDMLAETAYVKLGWVLGREKDAVEVKKKMLANVAGEYNYALREDEFMV